MTIRLLAAAETRKRRPTSVGREQFPLDFITEDKVIPWRANNLWTFPTFLGFGTYNGHRTVKVRLTEASTRQKLLVEFPTDQRITNIVYKRDKPQYTNAFAFTSLGEIGTVADSVNANGIGNAAANVWYVRPLTTSIRRTKFFSMSVNTTTTYPVVIEFYLVDDLTPF